MRFSQWVDFDLKLGLTQEWLLIRTRSWHQRVSGLILPENRLFLGKFWKWRKILSERTTNTLVPIRFVTFGHQWEWRIRAISHAWFFQTVLYIQHRSVPFMPFKNWRIKSGCSYAQFICYTIGRIKNNMPSHIRSVHGNRAW